jgi:hypothetical protein
MAIFFGNLVRMNEQHFNFSIHEVLELQKDSWWDPRTQFFFSWGNRFDTFKLLVELNKRCNTMMVFG